MIKSINVAGIEYEVNFVNEMYDDPNQMGSVVYQKSKILIRDTMSEDKKKQTLVHEMLHAIFNEAGIQQQDEDTINRVGIVLYQVLKENDLGWITGQG